MNDQPESRPPAPWWTFGYLWLVIAGPAAVAVACVITVWLTLAYPETVVAQDVVPALQARNHAATPAGPAR